LPSRPVTADDDKHLTRHVVAETTGTGAVSIRTGVEVATVDDDDEGNAENFAFAHSHDCIDCRTVAVAFQAVLVEEDAQSGSPVTSGSR